MSTASTSAGVTQASQLDPVTTSDTLFLGSLESTRGLAALSVALFHSFHLLPVDGARVFDKRLWELNGATEWIMRLVMVPFNGGAAVSLFFVLSGFVLHVSLRRTARITQTELLPFTLRRVLRIYPAFAINILLFGVVFWLLSAGLGADVYRPFPPAELLRNLSLADEPVNGATWTLAVELAAVPAILVARMARDRWGLRGLLAVTAFFILVALTPLNFRIDVVKSYYLFGFGMVAAELFLRGGQMVPRRALRVLVLSLAVLLCARVTLGNWSKFTVMAEALASAGLVSALAMSRKTRVHAWLEAGPARLLGRVSFSFYLYHPLALATSSIALNHWAGEWALAHVIAASCGLAFVSVALAWPAALASYHLVELPTLRLGRWIEARHTAGARKAPAARTA